ncbi:MAG TPA: hypothetical protein EYP21_02355 [Syntrophaceae bacterium]|nr:hypothetical protein [Syntrophaceae bacterium]
MISARVKICGINSEENANYLLRLLQEAWELEVQYLLRIPHDDPKDGHRKWKVQGEKHFLFSLKEFSCGRCYL